MVKKIFENTYVHLLLIAAMGILIYANSFQAPFLFDDKWSITDNPIIRDLENFYANTTGYQYNPRRFISLFSLAMNYRFGGLDVTGYHLFNLAVHLACALLVYMLVQLTFRTPYFQGQVEGSRLKVQGSTPHSSRLTPHGFIALFAALLFVAHPVQTQAVTYIVQRMTSLATFFYLLSLVLYVAARLRFESRVPSPEPRVQGADDRRQTTEDGRSKSEGGRWKWILLLAGATISAVLAMLTKEIAFTLPFSVLLYEFSFFRGGMRRRLLYVLPILFTLPIIPLSMLMSGDSAGELLSDISEKARETTAISRPDYLFTQFRVIVTYLRLLVLPVNQNLDYDYPMYTTFFTPPVLLSFLLLAALLALAVYLFFFSRLTSHVSRLISFGILWFFLALSVESSLIPISDVIFEHRLYLPSAGAFTAAAVLFFTLVSKVRRPGLILGLCVAAAGAILALGVATWKRNEIWKNSVSLWQDVVTKSPQKARAYINLGAALGQTGRMDEAIAALSEAARLQPDNAEAYANLGAALASLGRLEEALAALSEAARIEPGHPDTLNNLGIVLKDVGRLEESIAALSEAVRIEPDNARAWYNLGRTYALAGRDGEAETALRRALQIYPGYDNALVELSAVLNRAGKFRETEGLLAPKLSRLASRPDAHLALGKAAHCLGDLAASNRELAILQRLDPQYARELAEYMSRPCSEQPTDRRQ